MAPSKYQDANGDVSGCLRGLKWSCLRFQFKIGKKGLSLCRSYETMWTYMLLGFTSRWTWGRTGGFCRVSCKPEKRTLALLPAIICFLTFLYLTSWHGTITSDPILGTRCEKKGLAFTYWGWHAPSTGVVQTRCKRLDRDRMSSLYGVKESPYT